MGCMNVLCWEALEAVDKCSVMADSGGKCVDGLGLKFDRGKCK